MSTEASLVDSVAPSGYQSRRSADWGIAAVLILIAVGLPAVVGAATGALSLPQNDDWSYRRVAEHFAQTGHMAFNGWPSMTLVGQIVWSWPFLRFFGDHGWVFGVSTAVLAVIGISSAYYISRQLLERPWAVSAVLLLVLFPGFAAYSSVFMTDMPAFAAEVTCLALGIAALPRHGRQRWAFLSAALAIGAFGFSIREFAIVAPLAVLVCAAIGDGVRRHRFGYLCATLFELIVCAIIYIWSRHIPGGLHQGFMVPTLSAVARVVTSYFTLAFVLSPAVAVAVWRRRQQINLSTQVLATIAALGVGVLIDRHYSRIFVGNFLTRQGATESAVLGGGRPELFPTPIWRVMTAIALLSGALLAGLIVSSAPKVLRSWRRWAWTTPVGVLGVCATFLALGLFVYGVTSSAMFDRYLWPLAFVGAILLLNGRRDETIFRSAGPSIWPALGLSILLLLVTAALTVNAASYSAARWRAGQIAVSHGVPPTMVDAGFEWVGANATGTATPGLHPVSPRYEPWYAQMEPGFRECAVVSGAPLEDAALRLIGKPSYALVGFAGRRQLYVYLSSAPGC